MLTHPRNNVPGWQDVLDAFLEIKGDPELLAAGKDFLLLLLLRSIAEEAGRFIDERLECLKKYGVIIHSDKQYVNQRFSLRPVKIEVKNRKRTDWIEACALAFILDLLSGQMGQDPAVQNFLYKLKILFWHKNGQCLGERCGVVFKNGKLTYRICVYWKMIQGYWSLSSWHPLIMEKSYFTLVSPELSVRTRKLQPRATARCHNSIESGNLNIFVLYALSSKQPVKMADFWAILEHGRFDFLEYLLIDLPGKRLPYSLEDLIFIAFFTMPRHDEKSKLDILHLIEKASPGLISGVSDQYGGNPLWYSLLTLGTRPDVNADGTMKLSPLLHFLYDLCDHENPNCDGVSFDDLCRYYPSKFLWKE